MPNQQNVESPITLFGYGRSGTSVLYRSFALHPDVDAIGESANLIFTTWRALEQISGLTRYGKIDQKDYGADAARLVQQAFLTIFPSDKSQWMHKPINVPTIHRDFVSIQPDSDAFVSWYWTAFSRSFPRSKSLAIIRDPYDVFVSARKYFGFTDATIWRSLRFIYLLLLAHRQDFRIVVRYADMVARPEPTLRRICSAVELDFHRRMPNAFERLHVPMKGTRFGTPDELAERRKVAFTHGEERNHLVLDDDAKRTVALYHDVLSLFDLLPDKAPAVAEELP